MTERCRQLGHHKLAALRASLAADLDRYLDKSPMNRAAGRSLRKRISSFLTPDLLSVFLYRLAHWLFAGGCARTGTLISRINFFVHKVSIGPNACIGPGLRLPHPTGVVFGGRAGCGLTLYALAICGSVDADPGAPLEICPTLGDRVTLAAGAVVLGPLHVGDDAKISFHARPDRDVPAGVLVAARRRGIHVNTSLPAPEKLAPEVPERTGSVVSG